MSAHLGIFRIERVLYDDPDRGFAVVKVTGDGEVRTAVGPLSGVAPGDVYHMYGEIVEHPRYGRQFQVELVIPELPTTVDGVAAFLASHVPGVGPEVAAAIVQHLGPHALDIVRSDPGRLLEVPGVGPQRAGAITEVVRDFREMGDVLAALHGMGCTPGLARRLVRAYGSDAARVVSLNPYRPAREVWGVGFLTADRLALALGVDPASQARIEAGIEHVLSSASSEGHCALPTRKLIQEAQKLLEVKEDRIKDAIGFLEREGRVVRIPALDLVFTASMWDEEEMAARHVARLVSSRRQPVDEKNFRLTQVRALREIEFSLSSEQEEAVRLSGRGGIVMITGNPGTGKTTVLRLIGETFRRLGARVAAACPTGRAAQRLGELTGIPAVTVHRLLGYNPREGFAFGEGRPLPADVVLIDEASMLDLHLFAHLVAALPDGCTLVLVGDSDQLPSVGPGDVLRDLLRSEHVPHVRLRQIFRTSRHSLIVYNAHRIAKGEFPVLPTKAGQDVLFIPCEDPAGQVQAVVRAVAEIAPRLGYNPLDVPVFCPMYRGENGIDRLNEVLREALNPAALTRPELRVGKRLFRLGDRVLQTSNNYTSGVMNGELGIITGIDVEAGVVEVAFPDTVVRYRREDLGEIVPAWAISVHKSQGGEYPATVALLDTRHYVLLTRNLLYTALTRARELCIVVGSRRAIGMAVRNDTPSSRWTGLALRIKAAFHELASSHRV